MKAAEMSSNCQLIFSTLNVNAWTLIDTEVCQRYSCIKNLPERTTVSIVTNTELTKRKTGFTKEKKMMGDIPAFFSGMFSLWECHSVGQFFYVYH